MPSFWFHALLAMYLKTDSSYGPLPHSPECPRSRLESEDCCGSSALPQIAAIPRMLAHAVATVYGSAESLREAPCWLLCKELDPQVAQQLADIVHLDVAAVNVRVRRAIGQRTLPVAAQE
jgi:hypothetical protein